MLSLLLAVVVSYLIGSIPFAYIFGKVLKGIDIREHGSGNVGATNIVRTVGKGPGIAVFILDFLKGVVPVTLLPYILEKVSPGMFEGRFYLYVLLGGAAIAGHIWTIFLKFKGGKGVSTTAGVMAGMAPGIFIAGFLLWIAVFSIWKYVSLASLTAAISLPILAVLTGKNIQFVIFCAIICMVGVFSHRTNIKRLLQGTESQFVKAQKSQ